MLWVCVCVMFCVLCVNVVLVQRYRYTYEGREPCGRSIPAWQIWLFQVLLVLCVCLRRERGERETKGGLRVKVVVWFCWYRFVIYPSLLYPPVPLTKYTLLLISFKLVWCIFMAVLQN